MPSTVTVFCIASADDRLPLLSIVGSVSLTEIRRERRPMLTLVLHSERRGADPSQEYLIRNILPTLATKYLESGRAMKFGVTIPGIRQWSPRECLVPMGSNRVHATGHLFFVFSVKWVVRRESSTAVACYILRFLPRVSPSTVWALFVAPEQRFGQ